MVKVSVKKALSRFVPVKKLSEVHHQAVVTMMTMNLISQQLFSLALSLVLGFISRNAGLPAGVEFKQVKFCGPHDETARFKISPWLFIPSGKIFNVSVTFTPAVDVFAATMQYELITVKDGKTVGRGRDNACPKFPELCSLPAGEKYVWTYSDVMRAFPPGFQMTFRGILQLFNEEDILLLCWKLVVTIH